MQHDYVIEDQDGLSFLADLNALTESIVTQNSGATAPAVTYAHMFWADTSASQLKKRNAANTAWVVIGGLDDTGFGSLPAAGGTVTGDLTLSGATLIEAEGTSVAAAATADIWGAGNTKHITGNTTISSFGTAPQAGAWMKVIFDGTPTLTHSANLNLNNGGDDIPIQAGDYAWVYADSTTQFDVIVFRKSGEAVNRSSVSIVGEQLNLVITNNAATPNSQIDIDADEVILKNSSGSAYLATSVNLTLDITASSANGLDTGSEASSTWYYLWLIYNGTAVASLLSTSSTAPTMPSGYTHKALVGAVYNDSSSNFVSFHQIGRRTFTGPQQAVNSGTATTYTSVSLATMVPPIAKSASGRMRLISGSTTSHRVDVAANASDLGVCSTGGAIPTGSGSIYAQWNTPLVTAQTIYYRVTNGTAVVEVCEWEI